MGREWEGRGGEGRGGEGNGKGREGPQGLVDTPHVPNPEKTLIAVACFMTVLNMLSQ